MTCNSVQTHSQEVELNSTLLFLLVTCYNIPPGDVVQKLWYEFGKQPPAFFEKDLMRKGTKGVPADILKKLVTSYNRADPDCPPPTMW